MATMQTLLLATLGIANVAVSTLAVQAADLEREPRIAIAALHRHDRMRWHSPVPGDLVAGVRGGNPMTVPFYGFGWYPGTRYYYGWQRPICCAGADAVISVRY